MRSLGTALFVCVSAAAAQGVVAPVAPPPAQSAPVNVLPLVTGAPGPGTAAFPEECAWHVIEAPSTIPSAGGAVTIRHTIPSGRGCHKPSVGVSGVWLQHVEGSPGVLRFTAVPNDDAESRRAVLVIGSSSLVIVQAGLPVVQAASAPGRLVFGVDRKGRIDTRRLRVWQETAGGDSGTLTLSSTVPWIKLGKQETRKGVVRAEVSIDASTLPPDAYLEAAILATSSQPGRAPLRIPVLVERGQLR